MITVQKNCQKRRYKVCFCWIIKNDPTPKCFCCWEDYIQPNMCFEETSLNMTEMPVETTIRTKTARKHG